MNERSRTVQTRGMSLVVVVLVVVAVVASVYMSARRAPTAGSFQTLGLATTLRDTGTFAIRVSPENLAPTRIEPPAYASLIAALSFLDPSIAEGARCFGIAQTQCAMPFPFESLVALQTLAALLSVLLVYLIARDLSRSEDIALVTALLFAVAARLGELARLVSPYGWLTLLLLLVVFLIARAQKTASLRTALLAGGALGMASLLHASCAYLAIGLAPLLFLVTGGKSRRHAIFLSFTFAAGFAAPLAPWVIRNLAMFGDPALVAGEDFRMLAERMSYNALSGSEIVAAFLAWAPGFGNDLVRLVFAATTADKLGTYVGGTILVDGAARILKEAQTAAPHTNQFFWIAWRYGVEDGLAYLTSLPPVLWRGLWSSGSIFEVWGALALPTLIRRMTATGEGGSLLIAGAPILLLLAVHATTTANLPWTNVPMTAVFAYAVAHVVGAIELPSLRLPQT